METFLILSIILLGANSVFWPFWIYRRFRFPDNLEKQITDIEKILSVQQTNSEKFRDGVRNLSKDIDRVIVGIESSKNSLGKIDGIESTLSKQQSDTQKFYDDTKSLLSAVNQAAQDDSIEKKIDGIKGTLSGQQIDNQKSHEDTRCLLQSIEKTNLTQQDDHKNFHLLVQQVHQVVRAAVQQQAERHHVLGQVSADHRVQQEHQVVRAPVQQQALLVLTTQVQQVIQEALHPLQTHLQ